MPHEALAYRTEEGVVYKCPHCEKVNGREGAEELWASVCEHCGEPVTITETIDRRGETV